MMLFLRILILPVCLFSIINHICAQSPEDRNDRVFGVITKLISEQKGDSLYALLTDGFKEKMSRDAFNGILKVNLYPMGVIREYSFLSYTDGSSNYKAALRDGDVEFRLATDTAGKIAHLRFLPYKKPVKKKDFVAATSNTLQTAVERRVDTIARTYINKGNTVGISIGIVKDGPVTIYGYGETAKGNGKIPDAETIFELGSVSKTFTATLLAYYVLAHKLALSDTITKYLPDSVAANSELRQVTLQMLINHTSGLPRMPDNFADQFTDELNPYKYYSEKKLFAYLKDCKLQSAAGTKYEYSNLAAGILGVILERISGQTYGRQVEDIICKPLGMVNTIQHPNAAQQLQQAAVYNDKGKEVVVWDHDALAGAGALRSTVPDMLSYLQANMEEDNSPLSQAMQLTHKVTYNKDMTVGLGWHMDETKGVKCYWHSGRTGGSSCYTAFIPDKHLAVVLLSNASEDIGDIGNGILELVRE